MNRADLFILSSRVEGFGHVIVEAMATKTPVIATDCKSGPSEILNDGEFGILVPIKDYKSLAENTITMLKNDTMLKHFANLGYKRSMYFNAENIVKEYDRILKDY